MEKHINQEPWKEAQTHKAAHLWTMKRRTRLEPEESSWLCFIYSARQKESNIIMKIKRKTPPGANIAKWITVVKFGGGDQCLIPDSVSIYKFSICQENKRQTICLWTKNHRNHSGPFPFSSLIFPLSLWATYIIRLFPHFLPLNQDTVSVAGSQGILIHSGVLPAANGEGEQFSRVEGPFNVALTQSGGP